MVGVGVWKRAFEGYHQGLRCSARSDPIRAMGLSAREGASCVVHDVLNEIHKAANDEARRPTAALAGPCCDREKVQ